LFVLVGFILMIIGWILRSVLFHVDDNDAMKWVVTFQELMIFFGVAVLSLGLFHGSLKNDEIPDNIRMAMMISAGIIIGIVAANSSFIGAVLGGFF
jgi:hypothetical protein